jgi:NADPH-ferrihemoprotein reductase
MCLHLEFDLQQIPGVKYQTGDHLVVWPMNPDREVESLLKILGLQHKHASKISIKSHENPPGRPSNLPPSTTIEAEKDLFQFLGADRQRFQTEILASHKTLACRLSQINAEAAWHIPLSFLIERLRKIRPRKYSISSSAITQPRRPSVTVAVDTSHLNSASHANTCNGLATNYLLALHQSMATPDGPLQTIPTTTSIGHQLSGPRDLLQGGKVFGQIRRSTFKLPLKESTSILLIGAGIGIAPLRSFVQERARLRKLGRHVGKTMLIMGFRRCDQDFLYREEWDIYKDALGEDNLRAFSRDDPERRVYVQDRLRQHATDVFHILSQDDRSAIYICGSARMAHDILQELKRSSAARNHRSESDSGEWWTSLKRSARLYEDIWG